MTMPSGGARAVVAVQDEHGRVVYEYGWLGADGATFEWDVDRFTGRETASTTVSWLERPRRSERYPTDADFLRPAEIDAAQRALAGARRELAP